ncbi:MAG: DUF1190 domain-containing protein [Desulfovibrio sp.]|jgi:uncharacterized protein YgiB involved in biofilm formation|nr:DUF1190 domain-containing protein [Desulfovibrio sp.]
MKRSKALSLLLMGSMTAASAGCGTDRADEGMYTFTSLNECVTSAVFTEAECRELAMNALAETPRFSSREECEARFGVGVCDGAPATVPGQVGDGDGAQVQQHSGGMWMPMMMGFMAGRFLGGGGMMQGSQGLYRDPAGQQGQQGRSFRTAGGETVRADATGRVTNLSQRMTQSMGHNAKPVMGRSGSGARGGGFAGGGGGGS